MNNPDINPAFRPEKPLVTRPDISIYIKEVRELLASPRRSVRIASPEFGSLEDIRQPYGPEEELMVSGGSAHKVTSGILIFREPGGQLKEILCVLKRHNRTVKCEQEYNNTFKIRSLGIPTVEPVAVLGRSNQGAFIFTRLDHSLRPADTINWSALTEEQLTSFISLYAQALAGLHRETIFHHDPQLKNTNFSRDEASVNFFDWESAQVPNRRQPAISMLDQALDDILRAVISCHNKRVWSAQDYMSMIEEVLLSNYFFALTDKSHPHHYSDFESAALRRKIKSVDWHKLLFGRYEKGKSIIGQFVR